jgi:hypothetical protein
VYKLPDPDPSLLAEYEALDGVPQCLVDNALCARSQEEAEALASAFVGTRNGYANTADMPTKEGVF